MKANMMVEKITVIALVAILPIRKNLLYFWNFLCRRRLVEGSDTLSGPGDRAVGICIDGFKGWSTGFGGS